MSLFVEMFSREVVLLRFFLLYWIGIDILLVFGRFLVLILVVVSMVVSFDVEVCRGLNCMSMVCVLGMCLIILGMLF